MPNNINLLFEQIQKDRENLQKKKSTNDTQSLLEHAQSIISMCQQYVVIVKEEMDKAKAEMEASNTALNNFLEELNKYFDIDEDATEEEKIILDEKRNLYDQKKDAYFEIRKRYENNDEASKDDMDALSLLQQAKNDFFEIKSQAKTSQDTKKEEVIKSQKQAEDNKDLRKILENRRGAVEGRKDIPTKVKEKEKENSSIGRLAPSRQKNISAFLANRAKKPAVEKSSQSEHSSHQEFQHQESPHQESPSISQTQPANEKAYPDIVMQSFLKELHFKEGISLEKRIAQDQKKSIKLTESQQRQINMAQAVIDLLYKDENKSADEKGEIFSGLMQNLKQQMIKDKNPPLKKIIDENINILQKTNYLFTTSQLPLLIFMEAKGLKQSDPKTFDLFLSQSKNVRPNQRSNMPHFKSIQPKKSIIPGDMKKYEAGIKLFNQFLWPYVTPESLTSENQFTIKQRYEKKGGSHNKKNSIRENQIRLLQTIVDTLHQDNTFSGDEKAIILSGVLDNFKIQLESNRRSSKLYKVIDELHKPLSQYPKDPMNDQAALSYVKKLNLNENNPMGVNAFVAAAEKIQERNKPKKKWW